MSQKVRFNCRMESSFPVFLPYVGLLTNPPPEHHHIPSNSGSLALTLFLFPLPFLYLATLLWTPTRLDFSSLFGSWRSPASIPRKMLSQPPVNKPVPIFSSPFIFLQNVKRTFWLHRPYQDKPFILYLGLVSHVLPTDHQAHRLNQMSSYWAWTINKMYNVSWVMFLFPEVREKMRWAGTDVVKLGPACHKQSAFNYCSHTKYFQRCFTPCS